MGTVLEIKVCRYILTAINYFTKWIETIPLMNKYGEEGVPLFKLMTQYECPDIIISDQGIYVCKL